MEWLIFFGGGALGGLLVYFIHLGKIRNFREEAGRVNAESVFFREELKGKNEEMVNKDALISRLNEQRVRVETENNFLTQKITEQKEEISRIREEMNREFKLIASRVLDENSEKFSKAHQEKLGSILNPFREKIRDFEEQVKSARENSIKETSALREQLRLLNDLNRQLGDEARNLTRALKGDQKIQGNWGEVILKRVLEMSGLEEGREYIYQAKGMNLSSGEGERQIPDVVINLPDKKHLVIDAKVSLVSYERLMNEESEEERTNHLNQHLISLKTHIRGLSERFYQSSSKLDTPDFVLLFVPIEASFGAAVKADNELFDFAWRKKIVIVSPSTLLATLKTICSVWKYEYRQENAMEIARLGGSIYSQVAGFVNEMKKVENSLDQSKKSYESAMKKLYSGNQSIIKKAEKLRDLGIETGSKKIE